MDPRGHDSQYYLHGAYTGRGKGSKGPLGTCKYNPLLLLLLGLLTEITRTATYAIKEWVHASNVATKSVTRPSTLHVPEEHTCSSK